jgi:hypothetical protein
MVRPAHDKAAIAAQIPGMGVHAIELRWRGRCTRCATELAAGELARFDDVTHEISCLDCQDRARVSRVAAAKATSSPPPSPHPSEAERRRIRALIADARAALDGARRAS